MATDNRDFSIQQRRQYLGLLNYKKESRKVRHLNRILKLGHRLKELPQMNLQFTIHIEISDFIIESDPFLTKITQPLTSSSPLKN